MKIIFMGDIVGDNGRKHLIKNLRNIKNYYQADLVIANAENASEGNGLLPKDADELFIAGIDVITLGNHALRRKEIYEYLDRNPYIIRPDNFHQDAPGRGITTWDKPGKPLVTIVNLIGNVGMEGSSENVFQYGDRNFKERKNIVLVDFHGEATSEKLCFGLEYDGKLSAVLGTHTHIQTADERILPNKTAYISDVGMCGSFNSAIGVRKAEAVYKMKTGLPTHFVTDNGPVRLSGVYLEINDQTYAAEIIERINIE